MLSRIYWCYKIKSIWILTTILKFVKLKGTISRLT
jgi:hypothetical protein